VLCERALDFVELGLDLRNAAELNLEIALDAREFLTADLSRRFTPWATRATDLFRHRRLAEEIRAYHTIQTPFHGECFPLHGIF
jgi:hypothetical protein